MLKINKHYLTCFFISICLIFGACVPYQKAVKNTLSSGSIFETGISHEAIPAEIERLKDLTEDKTGKAVSVDVYLNLAILYSSYKNEDPDYVPALTALEKYMAVYNGGSNELELNTLYALLLRIRYLSKGESVNSTLIKKNKVLAKQNKELTIINEVLKETIEKLGTIDLNLEQKRKSYK